MEAIKDKAQELFDVFSAKLDSLLAEKDYLETSDPDFREGLEVLKEDFEKALKEIEYTMDDLLDDYHNHPEYDSLKDLACFDDEVLKDKVEENGYFCVKIEGMADRDKLQDFINQNIYPYNINLL